MKNKGFTLLEIMIALAIFAAAFVALSSLQGSTFADSLQGERLTTAVMLAQKKMTEVEMKFSQDMEKNKFPEESVEEGEFEEPFDDFRWKLEVKKVEIPLPEAQKPEVSSSNSVDDSVAVESYMQNIIDQISKSVREIKLTILWGDKDLPLEQQPNMSVTTHFVNLNDTPQVSSSSAGN